MKLKNSKDKNNKKYNDDLLMLLNEADHITLDDLEFDNILKEQSKILCNINHILTVEHNKGKNGKINENPVCNITNLNKDSKFKKIISNIENKKTDAKTDAKTYAKTDAKLDTSNKIKSFKKIKRKSRNRKHKIAKLSIKTGKHTSSKNIKSITKKSSRQNTKKKCKNKSKYKQITINKLTKKKYIYRHNNKRKYDITITKPNIFIKDK
jgi:hypothetical protein